MQEIVTDTNHGLSLRRKAEQSEVTIKQHKPEVKAGLFIAFPWMCSAVALLDIAAAAPGCFGD